MTYAQISFQKIVPSWTKVRRGLPLSIGRPYRFSPPPRSTGTTHPKIPLSFHFLVLGHNNHPACRRARGLLSLKSAFGCPSSSSKKIISEIIINRICQTTCSNLYSLSFSVLLATTGQAAMWPRRRSRFGQEGSKRVFWTFGLRMHDWRTLFFWKEGNFSPDSIASPTTGRDKVTSSPLHSTQQ